MAKLPVKLLDKLQCASCTKYLSCGPVKILPDGSGVCGRCEVVTETYLSKNYDDIASSFEYPCTHYISNCGELIKWNEVKIHEAKCSYKPGCMLYIRHPISRKKFIHTDEGVQLAIANDAQLKTLTCNDCEHYLVAPPVFITNLGTNLCFKCGQREANVRRNVPLETILQHFVLRCSFRNGGCTQYARFGTELSKHEQECEYAEMHQLRRLTSKNSYFKSDIVLRRDSQNIIMRQVSETQKDEEVQRRLTAAQIRYSVNNTTRPRSSEFKPPRILDDRVLRREHSGGPISPRFSQSELKMNKGIRRESSKNSQIAPRFSYSDISNINEGDDHDDEANRKEALNLVEKQKETDDSSINSEIVPT